MDSACIRIAVLILTVLASVCSGIELTINPTGELKQGDVVTITCTKPDMGPFDVVKLRRLGGPIPQDIITNRDLHDSFETTQRYVRGPGLDIDNGVIQVQINGITGNDRGSFECYDRGADESAEEYITVNVPPKSVEIRYENSATGIFKKLSDGDTLTVNEGEPIDLRCVVVIEGSTTEPTIMAKLGDENVISSKRFSVSHLLLPDGDGEVVNENNLYETVRSVTIKESRDTPMITDNGKAFMCSASMPGYDEPVTTTINMEVMFAPKLTCERTAYALLGAKDVMLTCKAQMNPQYTSVSWSFGDVVLESIDAMSEDGNLHFMHSVEDNQDIFKLHIMEVTQADFQDYRFTVNNGVGDGDVSETITLIEEEVPTTKMPKIVTPKKESGKGVNGNNPASGSDVNRPAVFTLAALVTVAAALLMKLL